MCLRCHMYHYIRHVSKLSYSWRLDVLAHDVSLTSNRSNDPYLGLIIPILKILLERDLGLDLSEVSRAHDSQPFV
jgi:hypothetical protein